ncbi:MAG: prephenate dehydrogenase/arogenate dehydrogenase family protein [Chitinispirillia bacterium]|jgi:prephenate dehydrogenase
MIENPVIGIVGGTGAMGQMFKKFLFEKHGYSVIIGSRRTDLSPEECAKKSDVLIITVPIHNTMEMIQNIAPFVKKDGLILDFTSLKMKPLEAMLKYGKCNVLGTHPMFGKGLKSLKNQTVIICPGRGKKWQDWYIDLLKKEGVKVKVCSSKEHDKMMAIIQGMIHFTMINIGHVLKELNIDIYETLEFSSPIYKLRLDMVGRVLNQDPGLYAGIQLNNPEIIGILEQYLRSSEQLFNIISNGNFNKFLKYFNEASDHLGTFKQEATIVSNKVINFLSEKIEK